VEFPGGIFALIVAVPGSRSAFHHACRGTQFDTIQFENPGVRSTHLLGRYHFQIQALCGELNYLDIVKIFAEEYGLPLRLRGAV
jgi:hypothetical protein